MGHILLLRRHLLPPSHHLLRYLHLHQILITFLIPLIHIPISFLLPPLIQLLMTTPLLSHHTMVGSPRLRHQKERQFGSPTRTRSITCLLRNLPLCNLPRRQNRIGGLQTLLRKDTLGRSLPLGNLPLGNLPIGNLLLGNLLLFGLLLFGLPRCQNRI